MSDQADGLRQFVQAQRVEGAGRAAAGGLGAAGSAGSRSLVLTSGKGGVGTSNLALNLAIALGEYGPRVVLVDADLGLANIDLLCGLTPACDLGDVLAGERPLSDAVVDGPGDIRIVPVSAGASGRSSTAWRTARRGWSTELAELEAGPDFLLVDAGLRPWSGDRDAGRGRRSGGGGHHPGADLVADAHAAIQRFRRHAGPPRGPRVVNQAGSAAEAADVLARLTASSREFLGMVVSPLGHVRADPTCGRRSGAPPVPGGVSRVRRLARRAPPGPRLVEERQPRSRLRLLRRSGRPGGP